MDDLRLHAVVARVVAWHNRHPLARRITAAQVDSVGYAALPYTAPGLTPPAPSAPPAPEPLAARLPALPAPAPEPVDPVDPDRAIDPDLAIDLAIDSDGDSDDPAAIVIDVEPERQADSADDSQAMTPGVEQPTAAPAPRPASRLRARATASEGDASPHDPPAPAAMPAPDAPRTLVCSEDFMSPIPVKAVLAWVHTHGLALPHDPGDGAVRQVPVDAALLPAGAGVGQLWVATAAIELGGQRHRLLLGGGAEPAVLGRRVWCRSRLLGALAAPCVLVASMAWWLWPAAPAAALTTVAVAAEHEVSAASAASNAAGPASVASVASAASAPEAGAPAVSAHNDTPSANAVAPRLLALLDEAAKAQARATVAALRAERQASAPATPAAVTTAATAAVPLPPAAADPVAPVAKTAPPPAVLFGLSTRLLRTRAEAEQLQSAFQTLLGGTPGSTVRVEMLPAGEDWRVVCWPFVRRADAERARALLLARGLRVELVDF